MKGPRDCASSRCPTAAASRAWSSIRSSRTASPASGRPMPRMRRDPMAEIPLHYRSATELGKMIREGKISSVELTTLYLDRLDKQGRSLNAVAELTRDLALRQARQADEERAAGKLRGPLHGVPFGAKDLLATAGIPTRWGSPAHKDQVFDYDATVIERLREAGAVLLAKLAMVELAGGEGMSMRRHRFRGRAAARGTRTVGPAALPRDRAR